MLKDYLPNLYILVSLSLLFSCTSNDDATIKFEVFPESSKGEIRLSFFCKKDTLFTLDWNAFQYEEYLYQEKKNLIEIFSGNPENICKNIKYNQLLLEDEFGDMRFFSDELLLPNESKVWIDIFSISSNVSDTIKLMNGGKETRNWQIRYKSDLKVTKKSTKVRFYYLQKMDQNELEPFILKSNWFRIKDVVIR